MIEPDVCDVAREVGYLQKKLGEHRIADLKVEQYWGKKVLALEDRVKKLEEPPKLDLKMGPLMPIMSVIRYDGAIWNGAVWVCDSCKRHLHVWLEPKEGQESRYGVACPHCGWAHEMTPHQFHQRSNPRIEWPHR